MKETCSLCYKYHNFYIGISSNHLRGKPHKAALILQEKEEEGWTVLPLYGLIIQTIIKEKWEGCELLRGVKYKNNRDSIYNRRMRPGNILLYKGSLPFPVLMEKMKKKKIKEKNIRFVKTRVGKAMSFIFPLPPQDSYLPFALIE